MKPGSRTRAFFMEEAAECLAAVRAQLGRKEPDAAALHAAARRLRGSAQLARYGGIARLAEALETRLRPLARPGSSWPEGAGLDLAGRVVALERALEAVRRGEVEEDMATETAMDGQGSATGVVAIEELEYSGAAALQRALDLRTELEDAIVQEQPVGPILDELFDLVQLGMR